MANTVRVQDILNGAAGEAYITMGTKRRPFMELVNITATMTKNKTEVPILGAMRKGNKATGATLAGSATMHKMTSDFVQYAVDYLNTNQDLYFDIAITNDDQTSTLGIQRVVLKNCNMDTVQIAALDADDSVLDEDFDFTFEDVLIESKFTKPELVWT